MMKSYKPLKKGRPVGSTIDLSNAFVPLSVRIPQYLRDRVDRIAFKKKQTRSECVLDAIQAYLDKHETIWKGLTSSAKDADSTALGNG